MDIWVSVYIVDGAVSDINAYKSKDEALNAFDNTVYDLGPIDDFEDYDRDEETGDCHFVENADISRHPVEMIVQRIPII